MIKETPPNYSNDEKPETMPATIPIVEDPKTYYFDNEPELQEGKIIHYTRAGLNREQKNKFLFLQNISGLHYIFSVSETAYGKNVYQLSFKTEEYDFATVNLDKNGMESLVESTVALLRTLTGNFEIDEIRISPADASYSAEEIEKCMEKILASPKNRYTKEELLSEYKGFRIFDLYETLFKKSFLKNHYNSKSRAKARSRLFKAVVKKYLPEWDVATEYSLGSNFTLVRKTKPE